MTMRIGLTGSIAMGKSEAAKILREHGLPVFDADAEVHKLYDSPEGANFIRPFVPEATQSGKVDRQIITAHVMKDPALLAQLEKRVHAEIANRREAFIAAAEAGGAKAVVLDIPLLFEVGADKSVDKTIVISSTPELQRVRALGRPGMTEERLNLILARQMPDAEKCRRADAVIHNTSTLLEMKKSLLAVLEEWGV
jgi:dephospho-CoA kinase